jgi:hypothetical protein
MNFSHTPSELYLEQKEKESNPEIPHGQQIKYLFYFDFCQSYFSINMFKLIIIRQRFRFPEQVKLYKK